MRKVERLPLGTPYPGVVARVREMVCGEALAGQCALVVDATGVGAPVVEMLRGARLGCEVTAVTITGGEKENGTRREERAEARSDRGAAGGAGEERCGLRGG